MEALSDENSLALVTGATGTYGRHVCKGLLEKGFNVICVVRNPAKGESLGKELGPRASVVVADLSRASAIEEKVKGAVGESRPLQCLVHCAAIAPRKRTESSEGLELQWAVNVLACHRLTMALMPNLQWAAQQAPHRSLPLPRVVLLSSILAGGFTNDTQWRHQRYTPFDAYKAGKQAVRMYTVAAAARFSGSGVLIASCHPGLATSPLSLSIGSDPNRSVKAQVDGAGTILNLCTAPKLAPGGFYFKGPHWDDARLTRCRFSSDKEGCELVYRLVELGNDVLDEEKTGAGGGVEQMYDRFNVNNDRFFCPQFPLDASSLYQDGLGAVLPAATNSYNWEEENRGKFA